MWRVRGEIMASSVENEVQEALEEAIQILRREVLQLQRWARESEGGGWSVHQVVPMRNRAIALTVKADQLELIFLRSRGKPKG